MTVCLRFEFLSSHRTPYFALKEDFFRGASICESFGVLCVLTLDRNIFSEILALKF